MVDHVKEMSGGLDDPVFLHELRDFCRHLTRATIVKSDVAAADREGGVGGAIQARTHEGNVWP
eukprot:2538013-Pyramimonas_sp.AAC.1